MSFEDDEYWEAEYHEKSAVSYVDDGAVARDPYAVRRPPPPAEPMPTRRPASARVSWDGDFDEPPAPGTGVDELAARRQRRGNSRPANRERRPQAAFDSERPGWLDDPDFVPPDISGPDLAGPESSVLDFNRPELGADFDAPEFGVSTSAPRRPARPSRGGARSLEEQFASGELDYGDLEYDEDDYLRDLDQARGGGRVDDSRRTTPVRRDDAPQRDRSPRPADDNGFGAAIRPPGGRRPRRTDEPGRYTPGQDPRESDRPRFAEPAASGRARVPEPQADFDFDELRTVSGRASVDSDDLRPVSGRASLDHDDVRPVSGRASVGPDDLRPVSGRTSVDSDDLRPVSGRASVDSDASGYEDVLDVYRPRRDVPGAAGPHRAGPLDDEFYREPPGNRPYRGEAARPDSWAEEALDEESRRGRRRPASRAETDPRTDQRRNDQSRSGEIWEGEFWEGDRRDVESWTSDLRDADGRPFGERRPAADLDGPDRRRTDVPPADRDQADRRPAADLDRGQRAPDETGHPDIASDSGVPDAEKPRVLSKSTPPTTPRVIHKAAPPATPKVIKKAATPATPKVIKKVEPTAPARVIKPAPPAIPAAASAPVPVAPNPAEVVRPRSAPPAESPRTAQQGRPEQATPVSPAPGPGAAAPAAAATDPAGPQTVGRGVSGPPDVGRGAPGPDFGGRDAAARGNSGSDFGTPDAAARRDSGPDFGRPGAGGAPRDESLWVTAERPMVSRPQAMPPAAAASPQHNREWQTPATHTRCPRPPPGTRNTTANGRHLATGKPQATNTPCRRPPTATRTTANGKRRTTGKPPTTSRSHRLPPRTSRSTTATCEPRPPPGHASGRRRSRR